MKNLETRIDLVLQEATVYHLITLNNRVMFTPVSNKSFVWWLFYPLDLLRGDPVDSLF